MLAGSPVLTLPAPAHAAKAGTCTIVGTSGDDVLLGTDGPDVICGMGGDDRILGRGGDDVLRGGGGTDVVRGGPGDDWVAGGRGGDEVFGQIGDDVVRGDAGDDKVVGGRGNDRLGGFRGADQMKADGDVRFVDHVRCGPGPDTVSADPADVVRADCETVNQSDPPTDITLVPSTIPENRPAGTDIGELTAVDPDAGDSHSFSLVPGVGSADNSLVRIDGDTLESAVRYDFENDASLSVRIRATDAAGEFTEKAFTVTVTDTNDAPVAVDDDATTTEDTTLDLPVSGVGSPAANDTDQDGDPLTVSAVSSPTGGTVSISGGQVHFVPAADLCGNNAGSFVYTVSDGDGGTDTGTVTVDITCVDDGPEAVNDNRTVNEDSGSTAFTVLSNDTDPEGDAISVTGVTQPDNGAVTFTANDVSYTPNLNYCNDPGPAAVDTFTYTITGGDSATVSVTVTCVNDAPAAVDDDRTTTEDTPLQDPVTGSGSPADNDNDVDGDMLTVTSVSNPTGGTVAIAAGEITFTPTANLCGSNEGSYDYVVSDGNGATDTGTVTVDITCVNDPPVANDDARTVGEDSGPTTFGTLLGNDTDVESDPIAIIDASDPANGTTSFTASDVTYTPDANFCGADTFTYTVNGGDIATVSMTVTCVDDAPVANDDSKTVAEDDTATAINVLGNDSDVENDAITISSASDPANGTVALTGPVGARTGLTYTPDPDYCNAPPGTTLDTFTYTVNGGSTATVTVTVTCADDAPVAVDDSANLTMNDAATSLPVLANDTDIDGGPMAIASATDPANGTVVLTGGSPGEHTGLTYQPDNGYCNTNASDPDDTFTYTLTPGGDEATVSVEVACDVPPVAVDDTATVGEDSGASAIDVLANDTNADGGAKVIVSSTDPANGTVALTGGSSGAHTGLTYAPDANYCNNPPGTSPDTFTYTVNGGDTATVSITVTCVNDDPVAVDDTSTVAEDSGANTIDVLANDTDVDGGTKTVQSVSGGANGSPSVTNGGAHVSYTPDPNFCGSDSFTYTVNGGDTATVSVTVTCVADAPTVHSSAGPTTFTEGDAPTAVDSAVTIANPDGVPITGGSVSITANAAAGDVLAWTDSPGDSITEAGSSSTTVVLTGNGTAAEFQAALQAVRFANSSDDPSTLARTVRFQITTGAGNASDTKTVQVVAVDDPPEAVNDSATVLEDAAATNVPVLTNDTDVDGGPKTISSATDPANGTVMLTGGGPGAHTGLTYQPDPNYCNNPPGTTPDTFTYTLTGGSNATVSMTVTCVNDAPVADNETFNGNDSAHGNTTLQVDDPDDNKAAPTNPHTEITGDILAGDTDVDGPGPLTVTPGTFATNDGGSVAIEADGDFVFQPATSTSCTDTSDFFDYTVEDSGSPELTGTGRVTIAIAGCVWYVHNNSPGNAGSSTEPFDTLTQAETASGTNHTVFVYDGDNTATGYDAGGYLMNSGERLIGEHEGLVVDPDQGGPLTADSLHPANAGALPTLTANNVDVIDLDDGNEIRGFNIDPQGTGGGIFGGAGDTGGGTFDDINIVEGLGTNGTQPGLELNGTTGTFNISNLVVNNNATGVLLNNAGTAVFDPASQISLTSTGAKGLDATGTGLGTSTFDDITVTGSAVGGISLTSTTGTAVALGDDLSNDLALTTSGGTGLELSNAANVTVGAAGSDTITATNGPALNLIGAATLSFDQVSSTNSTTHGLILTNIGTGTVDIDDGAIQGYTSLGLAHSGGSGNVEIGADILDGAGPNVSVANRTGSGTVTFAGAVTDGADNGGFISIGNNASTTVRFEGGVNLSTGNSDAFYADNGGTVVVTDPVGPAANTLTTTTGRALHIANTNIGSDDVTFERISSNGAVTGILLSNTGNASGGLAVTGNGLGTCTSAASCTGGAIQNSTGAGISLADVPGNVSLTRLAVTNGGDDGVRGTNVTGGFTLANGFLSSNGNAVGERGFDFVNVSGTSAITSSIVTASAEDNVRWENNSGVLGLTVTGSTFSNNSATTGADGFLLLAGAHPSNAPTLTASITGNTFQHNRDDGFQLSSSTPSQAQLNVTFNNNTVTQGVNNVPNNAAVTVSPGSNTDTKFKMDNNNLSGSLGSALILNPGPDSTSAASYDAIVTNNDIGTGAVDSGSVSGIGIWGRAAGNGVNRFEIRNNIIQHVQQQGMYLRGNEGTGQVTDYTVTGNSMINPDGTGFRVLLEAGALASDTTDVCVDFGGGGGLANTVDSNGSPADIGVARDFAANSLTLRDYAGGDLSAYFNSRNTGTPASLSAILSNLAPAGGAAACALPSTPPLP